MRCFVALVFVASVAACGGPKAARVGDTPVGSEAPTFRFDSLDARPVSSEAFRGKFSVIALISTGDSIGSQAEANYLVAMAKNDGDRVNYALVALQDGTTRELVEMYRDALKIPFPVAMGDSATTAGGGPFGAIEIVPTTLVLDPTGHVRLKKSGIVKPEELRAAMR